MEVTGNKRGACLLALMCLLVEACSISFLPAAGINPKDPLDTTSLSDEAGDDEESVTPDTTSAAHWFSSQAFFNQSVVGAAVDPDSATKIATLVANGGWGNSNRFQIDFGLDVYYSDANSVSMPFRDDGVIAPDSDIPESVPVAPSGDNGFESSEGRICDGGDCHYLAMDTRNKKLIEGFVTSAPDAFFHGAGSLAIWDTKKAFPSNLRGDVCTSADAGGLPIAPMLFTAEEVKAGVINHAIRFILPNARIQYRSYVRPASHGTGAATGWVRVNGIPYGSRFRLRADYPLSTLLPGAQVVAKALQTYGMILADGGQIALTAMSDKHSAVKWAGLMESRDLVALKPQDFEIIDAGPAINFTSFDCFRTSY